MQSGRAQGTTQHHDRVIKDYMRFVGDRGFPESYMSEQSMAQFMVSVQDSGKPYGYCTQVGNKIIYKFRGIVQIRGV